MGIETYLLLKDHISKQTDLLHSLDFINPNYQITGLIINLNILREFKPVTKDDQTLTRQVVPKSMGPLPWFCSGEEKKEA